MLILASVFVALNTLTTPVIKMDGATGTFFYSVAVTAPNAVQVEVGMCTWAKAKDEAIIRCTPPDPDHHKASSGAFKVDWYLQGKEVKADVGTSLPDSKIKLEFYVAAKD
jgi:hypothetical protein